MSSGFHSSAEQQQTITRDSVTIRVNAVLWYRVTEASKAVIEVSDASSAVYQLALTSLRNIIGRHDLDEVLQERDKINGPLRENMVSSTVPEEPVRVIAIPAITRRGQTPT